MTFPTDVSVIRVRSWIKVNRTCFPTANIGQIAKEVDIIDGDVLFLRNTTAIWLVNFLLLLTNTSWSRSTGMTNIEAIRGEGVRRHGEWSALLELLFRMTQSLLPESEDS